MWKVYVNNARVENIHADTFMEAELQARILYGWSVKIDISLEDVRDE